MARRAAAVRTFTAWAHATGLIDHDPGQLLASPRSHRTLPPILAASEATALMDVDDSDNSPIGLRDRLVVELLYASGIRVAELVGLDIDDVDRPRRVLRVMGKGSKERTVPFGTPALAALGSWLSTGRPDLIRAGSGPALLLGARGGRIDQRTVREIVHRRLSQVPGAPDWARTGCAIPRRPICSTAAPTCARCRSCSVTRASPPPRSTPTSRSSDCGRPTYRRTREPDGRWLTGDQLHRTQAGSAATADRSRRRHGERPSAGTARQPTWHDCR